MSDTRFEIGVTDMGGWVRVFLSRGEPTGELAMFLSRTLDGWMKNNPQVRVRMIVPITANGDTAELHAWYDRLPVSDARPDAGESPE